MPEAVRRHPFILAAEPKGDKLRRWQSAIFETFGAIDIASVMIFISAAPSGGFLFRAWN